MAKSTSKPIATSKPSKLAVKPVANEAIPAKPEGIKDEEAAEVKAMAKVAPKAKPEGADDKSEITIEKKLVALYSLQQVDSQVDKIRIIRGELPLEVQDLEDEIAGLETRIDNHIQETVAMEKSVNEKKLAVKDALVLIKKYEDQQMNVRNNREYDSLTKEIEYQNLEIQLAEKRTREFQTSLELKTEEIERYQKILQDRKNDLEIKRNELDDIIAETEKEENDLITTNNTSKSDSLPPIHAFARMPAMVLPWCRLSVTPVVVALTKFHLSINLISACIKKSLFANIVAGSWSTMES